MKALLEYIQLLYMLLNSTVWNLSMDRLVGDLLYQDVFVLTDNAEISWIPIADPKGGKSVTSLLIGTVKGRKAGQSATVVWAGTKQQKLKAATYYAIDPTPNTFDPWTIFSPDSDADRILDIQPASLDGEDGLFVYSERLDRTECKIYSMASDTLEKTNSKSTLQGHLGKINGIYSSKNPWK